MSQVVEQVAELPKTSSRDRSEMVKHLVEAPKTVSQDRIQQRTVEQIVDIAVPKVGEELVEVSKVVS